MHTMTSPSAAGPTRSCDAQDDYLLQPPNPAERVPCRIDPVDLRRLDLHAILTAAGIAPSPGDHDAIDQLSRLPGSVHTALHRWLAGTRRIESATAEGR
ncbi:hypothetical protein AB0L35_06210 [Streptomyces sp. NPDC052309]|uniref:Uncharacterized protein n=1 Tax=Streptomyces griseicoloratus TaxID=2752516 RepID=A0A926L3Q2_9ACTN|nr:hypothetical protein [Streptomyces griseicoloratus]MBD0421982.1 hypothetical protein [Streptomyces griseicoloratus]